MKKVLVLTVVMALLATSAFAAVRNTKHDMSSSSTTTGLQSNNYNEVCVFCHTPHGASTTIALAPLWNRSHLGAEYNAPGDLYNSVTLTDATRPTTVVDAVNASDARLCMSCHDGTSLAGGLLNPANSSNNAQPDFTGSNAITGDANLGATLVNDHPIGMDYSTAQGADLDGLVTETDVETAGLTFYFYSATQDKVMWCSTCHDVHDSGAGQPFLVLDNAGSALCTTCHNK